jgi:uncharacterized protein (DUF2062 family)
MTLLPGDLPPSPKPASLRARAGRALRALLGRGHTPEKIALSIAMGIAIGLFPIFGTTTVLCVLAALALRLNHPAIQLTNQLMYPVQIPLIVVFIRIGESMLGVAPIPFSAAVLVAEMRANPGLLVERFGAATLHGILGWSIVAPVVVGLAYFAILPVLRIVQRRPAPAEAAVLPGR